MAISTVDTGRVGMNWGAGGSSDGEDEKPRRGPNWGTGGINERGKLNSINEKGKVNSTDNKLSEDLFYTDENKSEEIGPKHGKPLGHRPSSQRNIVTFRRDEKFQAIKNEIKKKSQQKKKSSTIAQSIQE